MNWWGYVTQVAGTDQQKDIAARAGIDQSTVSRWKSTGNGGRPDNVAALARAYRRPVLEAFVAAGFLTAEEAKQRPTAQPSTGSFSDDQLVDEIRNRLRKARESDDPVTTRKSGRKGRDDKAAAVEAAREAVHRQQGSRERETPHPRQATGDSHAG